MHCQRSNHPVRQQLQQVNPYSKRLPLVTSSSSINIRHYERRDRSDLPFKNVHDLRLWANQETMIPSELSFFASLECDRLLHERDRIRLASAYLKFGFDHLRNYFDHSPCPTELNHKKIHLLALGLFFRVLKQQECKFASSKDNFIFVKKIVFHLNCSDYEALGTRSIVAIVKVFAQRKSRASKKQQENICNILRKNESLLKRVVAAIKKSSKKGLSECHAFISSATLPSKAYSTEIEKALFDLENLISLSHIHKLAKSTLREANGTYSSSRISQWMGALLKGASKYPNFKTELATDCMLDFWEGKRTKDNSKFQVYFLHALFQEMTDKEVRVTINAMAQECGLECQTIILLMMPYIKNTVHKEKVLKFSNDNPLRINEWFEELIKVEYNFHKRSALYLIRQIRLCFGSEALVQNYLKQFTLAKDEFYLFFSYLQQEEQQKIFAVLHLTMTFPQITQIVGTIFNKLAKNPELYDRHVIQMTNQLILQLSDRECKEALNQFSVKNCDDQDFDNLIEILLPIVISNSPNMLSALVELIMEKSPDHFWRLINKCKARVKSVVDKINGSNLCLINKIFKKYSRSIPFEYKGLEIDQEFVNNYLLTCAALAKNCQVDNRWTISEFLSAVSLIYNNVSSSNENCIKTYFEVFFIVSLHENSLNEFKNGLRILKKIEDHILKIHNEKTPVTQQNSIHEVFKICKWFRNHRDFLSSSSLKKWLIQHKLEEIFEHLMSKSDKEFKDCIAN